MNYVNFEFPEITASNALTELLHLTEVNTLVIYDYIMDKSEFVFKGKAKTTARADEWMRFCLMFDQECVALSVDGKRGVMCGPHANKWTFNSEYFVL